MNEEEWIFEELPLSLRPREWRNTFVRSPSMEVYILKDQRVTLEKAIVVMKQFLEDWGPDKHHCEVVSRGWSLRIRNVRTNETIPMELFI